MCSSASFLCISVHHIHVWSLHRIEIIFRFTKMSYWWLWVSTLVVGIEPRTFTRVAIVTNHWATPQSIIVQTELDADKSKGKKKINLLFFSISMKTCFGYNISFVQHASITTSAGLPSFYFINQMSHRKCEFFIIPEIPQENMIYLFNLNNFLISILALLLCVEMQPIS